MERFLTDAMNDVGLNAEIETYAVSDFDSVSQKFLLANSRSGHVFGNLMDVLQDDYRKELTEMYQMHNSKYNECGQTGADKIEFKEHCVKALLSDITVLADKFRSRGEPVLSRDATSWCFRCEKFCRVFPSKDDLKEHGVVHVEIFTPTCVSWSAQSNKKLRWLCETNLPLVGWLEGMRTVQPHAILQECVVGLDYIQIQLFHEGQFDWSKITVNPTDVGYPVTGERSFGLALNRKLMKPLVVFNQDLFERCAKIPVKCGGNVFLLAPEIIVDKYTQEWATRRRIPKHLSGKAYPLRDIMHAGNRLRLERYERLTFLKMSADRESAAQTYLQQAASREVAGDLYDCDLVETESVQDIGDAVAMLESQTLAGGSYFFNISQNAYFHTTVSNFVPRPLCASLVWSTERDGLLAPVEMLCVQGQLLHSLGCQFRLPESDVASLGLRHIEPLVCNQWQSFGRARCSSITGKQLLRVAMVHSVLFAARIPVLPSRAEQVRHLCGFHL